MDRYDGSDDGGDEQSQTEPVSGEASAWGLSEQPAYGEVPSAPGGADEAVAEYAAWSADASYQQAPATSDTGGYTTTEQPVAAFNDQQQSYPQQPAYDPNAYAQPGYDPNAYAQQQQAYAQPGYDPNAYAQQQQAYAQPGYDANAYAQQQQEYAQPGYDPNAYAQQQQAYAQQGYDPNAYAQQQQAYAQQQPGYGQQQGYYDPNAYAQQGYAQQPGYPQQPGYGQQPGYYDQNAYGQQPSYYDQQAYAQQQYPQGYPAPGQPYAYAQPGQQPWPQDQYWDPKAGGYGRSLLAVLAGAVLLAWGLIVAIAGGVIMWRGNLNSFVADMVLTPAQLDFVTEFNKQAFSWGAVLLLIGITLLIGGIGIFSHRSWGRAFGIVLGFLGVVWGIALVVFSTIDVKVGDTELTGDFVGNQAALAFAVVVLVSFLLVFLAMFVGRRHFRRKGVA